MKTAHSILLAGVLAIASPLVLANDSRTDKAMDKAKPTQGTGQTHDRGAEKKGAQELPSGAQTGGMRSGIPDGAGRGGQDPNANKPSTKGPDQAANPDNRRGAGTEDSRNRPSR